MKIKYIMLTSCCMALFFHTDAVSQKKVRKAAEQSASANIALIDKQASELMAKVVAPAQVATDELAIAKLEEYNRLMSRENLMFPADELYQSNWDTIRVNPSDYLKIDMPDSYTIDCRAFVMPVDNFTKVTSKYGPRRRRMHRGTDLDLETGDTVRAAFDGKVRIKSYEKRGYGYYLVLRHPNGLETVYGHLSKFLVDANQVVKAGQVIGLGGRTGRSTGSHLHFETRFLGKDINPEELIDFQNGTPHRDEYTFTNIKINGKKSNLYATSPNSLAVHRVKSGETLSQIARKYGTSVDELCRINGITKTSKLSIGQSIQFRAKQVTVEATDNAVKQTPADNKTAAAVSSASNAKKQASEGKKIEVPVADATSQASATDNVVYHSIKSGETLFNIAQKYNTTVEKLCELNNISNNTILKIGQKIRCS